MTFCFFILPFLRVSDCVKSENRLVEKKLFTTHVPLTFTGQFFFRRRENLLFVVIRCGRFSGVSLNNLMIEKTEELEFLNLKISFQKSDLSNQSRKS